MRVSEIGRSARVDTLAIDDRVEQYNCVARRAASSTDSTARVEQVGADDARCHVDIAALKGVAGVGRDLRNHSADLQAALADQKLTCQGDASSFTWMGDCGAGQRALPARRPASQSRGEWLARQDPMIVGATIRPWDSPNPDPDSPGPCTSHVVVNGITCSRTCA